MLLPMTPPHVGLPPPLHPFLPGTAPPGREPSGIQGFPYKASDPGFLRPKFTKDTCRDADAVPGSWAPSPWSGRKSVSFSMGERGSLSEGSSLPVPSPGFPAPPAPAPGPQQRAVTPSRSIPCFTSRSQRNVCGSDTFQLILEERKFLQLETAEIWGRGRWSEKPARLLAEARRGL